jgi:hypothetical protein
VDLVISNGGPDRNGLHESILRRGRQGRLVAMEKRAADSRKTMGPNFPEVQLKAGASDCKEHAWRRLGLAPISVNGHMGRLFKPPTLPIHAL